MSNLTPSGVKKYWHDEQVRLHKGLVAEHGDSIKALGWFDEDKQKQRFMALAGAGDLNNKSILDVGCGYADLYGYLQSNNIKVRYTGTEYTPEFRETARKKYGQIKVLDADILSPGFKEKFDFVFAAGIFNSRMKDNKAYIQLMLRKMFGLAREGVAVTFFSTYVDFKERRHYHQSPEKIFSFGKSLTPWVDVRHDFMPYEYALYLYKDRKTVIPA